MSCFYILIHYDYLMRKGLSVFGYISFFSFSGRPTFFFIIMADRQVSGAIFRCRKGNDGVLRRLLLLYWNALLLHYFGLIWFKPEKDKEKSNQRSAQTAPQRFGISEIVLL